jgi:hypothetical protein
VNRNMSRGEPPTIVVKAAAHRATTERGESQRRGLQGRGEAKRLRLATEVRQAVSQTPRGSPHVAADPATDERMIALQNWGRNAEKRNSAGSPKKPWTKPTFGEERRDFAKLPLEQGELAA